VHTARQNKSVGSAGLHRDLVLRAPRLRFVDDSATLRLEVRHTVHHWVGDPNLVTHQLRICSIPPELSLGQWADQAVQL